MAELKTPPEFINGTPFEVQALTGRNGDKMTPEEKAEKCLRDNRELFVFMGIKTISELRELIKGYQLEAMEASLDFIRQALRLIPNPYVSIPERNGYNEALDEACKVVDALTPEKILRED